MKRAALAVLALVLFPNEGRGQSGAVVELQPAASFTAESFTRVRGLHVLSDGRLLVTDQGENAVWRVDLASGVRERVGREGPGPDEYRTPIGLHPFRGDSVVLNDLGNGRLAVLGPDLRMGRTIPMFAIGGTIPGATDTLGRFYVDRVTETRIARQRDARVGEQAALLRVTESAPERGDTVAQLTVAGPPNPQVWYPWDGWAVGADGRVLVVRNQNEYRVDWYGGGRRVRGPVVAEERLPVTAEDRRLWTESHPRGAGGGVSFGEQSSGRRPASDFPDRFPFVNPREVWVDAEGRGWVGRHQHQDERRPLFDVFDGSGRRVAQVRLPAGRQVIGFGPGSLYAVRVDEVDLQWIERYDTGIRPLNVGERAGGIRP